MKRVSWVVALGVGLIMLMAGMASAVTCEGMLNINTASVEELQMLPGIGESTAQNIVDFREANGPFASIDDLLKVRGIGEVKLEAIRPFVGLEGESTLRIIE